MGFANILSEMPRVRGLTLLASLVSTYLVGTVVYRLFFHPLARVPGPFWARISTWPAYWHTCKRDRHVWLLSLQETYGPTFRIGPDSVLVNTPTGYRSIYGVKANTQKSLYYKAFARSVDAITTWNSIDNSVHARKRRVLNNAFSDKALRSAEAFIHQNLDRWCVLIDENIGSNQWSPPLNMAKWADHLVFDILGDLCFGKSFGMKEEDSKLRHVPELLVNFLAVLHPIAYSPFAALWVWLKPRGLNALLAVTAPPSFLDLQRFVESCLAQRSKVEEDLKNNPKPESEVRKDFFYYLFKAVDSATGELGYSKEELYGESESLMIAGGDSTAITIAASFFYLARFPAVQAKLAREIRSAFARADEIKAGPTLRSCEYLRAVIEETLRMNPPTPAELPREALDGGVAVDGHFFPPGINVSTSIYCLQRNRVLYPQPERFRPERWIAREKDADGSSAEEVARAQSGFCAFSTGPRGCPGKNLAYLETSVVLAKVLFHFDVQQDPRSNNLGGGSPEAGEGRRNADEYQLHDVFVGMRDGPLVQFRRREHA